MERDHGKALFIFPTAWTNLVRDTPLAFLQPTLLSDTGDRLNGYIQGVPGPFQALSQLVPTGIKTDKPQFSLLGNRQILSQKDPLQAVGLPLWLGARRHWWYKTHRQSPTSELSSDTRLPYACITLLHQQTQPNFCCMLLSSLPARPFSLGFFREFHSLLGMLIATTRHYYFFFFIFSFFFFFFFFFFYYFFFFLFIFFASIVLGRAFASLLGFKTDVPFWSS